MATFGGFGGFGAAAPAATGFGTNLPAFGATAAIGAPAPAPTTGFGGFGSTPAFGAAPAPAPAPAGFGGFGAPAPAPAPAGFGGFSAPAPAGFGGFGAPAPAPAPAGAAGLALQVSLPTNDTVFKDLSTRQKDAIQDLEKTFKDSMHIELSKIASATDKKHADLHLVLSEVKVLAMKLETRQRALLDKAGALRGEVHEATLDCRRFGREEMHRIATRQDSRAWSQDLPNPYFIRTLQKLKSRIQDVNSTTEQLEKVMRSVCAEMTRRGKPVPGGAGAGNGTGTGTITDGTMASGSSSSSSSSGSLNTQLTTYESNQQQRLRADHNLSTDEMNIAKSRVGPKQVHRIMQLQMQAFMSLTASVAELHRTTNDLRSQYLDEINRRASGSGGGSSSSSSSSRGSGYSGDGNSSGTRRRLNPFESADIQEEREQQQRQRRIADILEDGNPNPTNPTGSSTTPAPAPTPTSALTSSFGTSDWGSAALGTTATAAAAPAPVPAALGLGFGAPAPVSAPAAGASISFNVPSLNIPGPVPLQGAASFGTLGGELTPGKSKTSSRRSRK